jgi:hypothetical protein
MFSWFGFFGLRDVVDAIWALSHLSMLSKLLKAYNLGLPCHIQFPAICQCHSQWSTSWPPLLSPISLPRPNQEMVQIGTLVQARHLQLDSLLLSYSSRRPVDENIKLEGRKEEVEKQETSRYRWMYGHVSQVRIKPSHKLGRGSRPGPALTSPCMWWLQKRGAWPVLFAERPLKDNSFVW